MVNRLSAQEFRALPKAELHLHLRGAMPPELFGELFARYRSQEVWKRDDPEMLNGFLMIPAIRALLSSSTWSPDRLDNLSRFTSFDHFLYTFRFTGCFFREQGSILRATR